jgi:feruloyl-CoA synthase
VLWVDPENPLRGLAFAGRLSEDFKLASGTWVNVSALRMRLVEALAPLVTDAAIAGHDRENIGALLFMNEAECRAFCPDETALPREALAGHPALAREISRRLTLVNSGRTGSSHRIERALLLPDPPAPEAFEITDKGYLNQRAVLERRSAEVDRLYRVEPGIGVAISG